MRLLSTALFAAALLPGAAANHHWSASWIDCPGSDPQAYGVYHFRKVFNLAAKPENLTLYVSGDNRYQFFVNGELASVGPARGDLTHWRYETIDIARYAHAGSNTLAAVVWNDGPHRAVAQVSNQTAFLVEAADPEHSEVDSDASWKAWQDKAYSPFLLPRDQATGYYALGPNERVDAGAYPWGWQDAGFNDAGWPQAHAVSRAEPRDARDAPNRWMLVPSEIPREEQQPERPLVLRTSTVATTFPGGSLTVPAHSEATLLLDQTYLTTAYPEVIVSGGTGAKIELHYAEALFDQTAGHSLSKGDRNKVEGKRFLGPFDIYIADGAAQRTYRPLFWRTYRYLQLRVETGDKSITVQSLRGVFTGYPFHRTGVFTTDDSSNGEIQRILGTGWRTARLCAHETYMDCPFYEQLQYAGDARIQMMISLYMTGDARLMKNGISLINSSRTAEGATYSRAPSNLQQYIPPFSLWWVGMVHDYWMYVDDESFVRSMLPGVEAVLSFYGGYQKPNGSLNRMPWWNFVDWVKQWQAGEPPADPDGSSSAALDLQLVLAYDWAADLEHAFGTQARSNEYRQAASKLRATIRQTDWDEARGLFADQPSHASYSQQVNTLAVLAHLAEGKQARAIVEKMFADQSLAKSSIYFLAYTNATLREAGLGDRYLGSLGQWRDMLNAGLTTWAEEDRPGTRSDCHAWGASPNFEFLRTVAGIESAAPSFKQVRVAPNLGMLPAIHASMPHPHGNIVVDLRGSGQQLTGTVALPPGTSGNFSWRGVSRQLKPGPNDINVQSRQ